jgi:hypothetical protein
MPRCSDNTTDVLMKVGIYPLHGLKAHMQIELCSADALADHLLEDVVCFCGRVTPHGWYRGANQRARNSSEVVQLRKLT